MATQEIPTLEGSEESQEGQPPKVSGEQGPENAEARIIQETAELEKNIQELQKNSEALEKVEAQRPDRNYRESQAGYLRTQILEKFSSAQYAIFGLMAAGALVGGFADLHRFTDASITQLLAEGYGPLTLYVGAMASAAANFIKNHKLRTEVPLEH